MLQPATLAFLRDLSNNNSKEWFDAQRAAYDAARKDFEAFVESLRAALVPLVPQLESQRAKDLTFRIFRDVRFSKDKRPYKSNFGAYFSKGGKKSAHAGYYLHLEPGKSFLAAGLWMPEAPVLKAVRQEIDYSFEEFRGIVGAKAYRKIYPQLEGEKLKTPPQGFAADHPGIEYLKHKSFIASSTVGDDLFLSKDAVKKCAHIFSVGQPLVDFLNRAVE